MSHEITAEALLDLQVNQHQTEKEDIVTLGVAFNDSAYHGRLSGWYDGDEDPVNIANSLLDSLDKAGYAIVKKPVPRTFINKALESLDPWNPNLTKEQKVAILEECKKNPWYFFHILKHDK